MRTALLVVGIAMTLVVGAGAYDASPLPSGWTRVFENGKADRDFRVFEDPMQGAGGPLGPDRVVVASGGNWVFIRDLGRYKYFTKDLEFVFIWDNAKQGGFEPLVIEGDMAYGVSYLLPDEVAFCVVDLSRRTVVAKHGTGVQYDELWSGPPYVMRRRGAVMEFDLYVRAGAALMRGTFDPVDGTFVMHDRGRYSDWDFSLDTRGYAERPRDDLPPNEYAQRSGLVVARTRIYFGEYRGWRVWLSTMSPRYADGSSQKLFRMVGATDPETLFVLVGKSDDHGTPVKGFYLPALKHYQGFDPLLTFSQEGEALLMYVDDATKRVHIVGFDMDDLVDSLPQGAGMP